MKKYYFQHINTLKTCEVIESSQRKAFNKAFKMIGTPSQSDDNEITLLKTENL